MGLDKKVLITAMVVHDRYEAANFYYRLRYGIDFKGDMRYVAELARKVGKRVERVDEDLLSIYEKDREVLTITSLVRGSCLVSILLVLLLCFVVYGRCMVSGLLPLGS